MRRIRIVCYILLIFSYKISSQADTALANRFIEMSDSSFQTKDLKNAIIYGEKALEIYQSQTIAGIELPQTYNHLGILNYYARRPEKSREYFKNGVDFYEKFMPDSITDLKIELLNNLAVTIGNLQESINIQKRALSDFITLHGNQEESIWQRYYNLGSSFQNSENMDSAEVYLIKGLEQRKQFTQDTIDVIAAHFIKARAHIFSNKGRYTEAIDQFKHALQVYKSYNYTNPGDNVNAMNGLAEAYKESGDLKSALQTHFEVEALILQTKKPFDYSLATTYNNIGTVYNAIGNLEKTLEYHMYAQKSIPENLRKQHMYAAILSNMAVVYSKLGDPQRAIHYNAEALKIDSEIYGKDHINVFNEVFNLAMQYNHLEEEFESKNYVEKALEIAHKKYGEVHPLYLKALLGKAVIIGKREIKQEKEYLLRGLEIAESLETNIYFPEIYSNLSNVYLKEENFQQAIEYADKAISFAKENGLEVTIHPFINKIKGYYFAKDTVNAESSIIEAESFKNKRVETSDITEWEDTHLFTKTVAKHKLEEYRQKGEMKDLEYAGAMLNQAITDHTKLRQSPFYKSNMFLGAKVTELTGLKMQYLYLKYVDSKEGIFIDSAFLLADQAKYFEIKQHQNINGIKEGAQNNEEFTNKNSAYKQQISHLKRQIFELNIKDPTNYRRIELSDSLSKVVTRYDAFLEQNTAIFRGIEKLKTKEKKANTQNTSVLNFVRSEDYYYVLCQNGEEKIFYELENKNEWLEKSIDSLVFQGILGYHGQSLIARTRKKKRDTEKILIEKSSQIFDFLLGPIEHKLKNNIVIVPDGVLNFLPFGALVINGKEQPSLLKANFWIEKHQFSFATKTINSENGGRVGEASIVAFAPFSAGLENEKIIGQDSIILKEFGTRYILEGSKEELDNLKKRLDGSFYYSDSATLEKFLEHSSNAGLIHLSSHATSNMTQDQFGYMLMRTIDTVNLVKKIYSNDILGLDVNAQLVVLSGCETGKGRLRKGEGVMSLSRAFLSSGAKSVVSTVWKIDDTQTTPIILQFYENLLTGLPIDEALAKAQVNYMREARGNGDKIHPYFWAGFQLFGNTLPIKLTQSKP